MKTTCALLLSLTLICRAIAAEPAQLELAQKVIKASQFDRIFNQMGAQMQQMAAQSIGLSPSSAEQTPEQKAAVAKTMEEVTKLSVDATKDMLQKVDNVYAEVYSEAELKAMLAFFESPEGKSMVEKQPQVTQRMMPLVQAMQREVIPKIQQIVQKAKAEAGVKSGPALGGPTFTPSPGSSGPAPGGPTFTPSPDSSGPVPMPTPSSSPGPTPKPAPAGSSTLPVPNRP